MVLIISAILLSALAVEAQKVTGRIHRTGRGVQGCRVSRRSQWQAMVKPRGSTDTKMEEMNQT